jgi:hypothetical protein
VRGLNWNAADRLRKVLSKGGTAFDAADLLGREMFGLGAEAALFVSHVQRELLEAMVEDSHQSGPSARMLLNDLAIALLTQVYAVAAKVIFQLWRCHGPAAYCNLNGWMN